MMIYDEGNRKKKLSYFKQTNFFISLFYKKITYQDLTALSLYSYNQIENTVNKSKFFLSSFPILVRTSMPFWECCLSDTDLPKEGGCLTGKQW